MDKICIRHIILYVSLWQRANALNIRLILSILAVTHEPFYIIYTVLLQITLSYCITCFFQTGALAENNRLRLSGNVIKAYSQIMSAHRKEVTCVVTTAKVTTIRSYIHFYNQNCMYIDAASSWELWWAWIDCFPLYSSLWMGQAWKNYSSH